MSTNTAVAKIDIRWDSGVKQWVITELDANQGLVASMQVNYKSEAKLVAAHAQRHWPTAEVNIVSRVAA